MKLVYQYADGRRSEDAGEFHAYSKALDAARIHFRFNGTPPVVAAYLRADSYGSVKERFVRTYTRNPDVFGGVGVENGYHPRPEPVTLLPGLIFPSEAPALEWARTGYLSPRDRTDWRDLPEVPGDQLVSLTQRAFDAELAEADRLGYNRGFKVGIAHRNRDRAAQLRRQADSLDRTADANDPKPLYAHQMGKTFTLEHAAWVEAGRPTQWQGRGTAEEPYYRTPHPLPGSVRAGVTQGDRR